MSDLADRIANLSAKKYELLRRRLNQEKAAEVPAPIPPRQEETHVFPLSLAQQRLWLLDQLEPGNPFYNMPAAVHLTGTLNIPILEQSLNDIIQRHETLRTTFTLQAGQPVQVIAPVLQLTLPIIDLQALAGAEQAAEVTRLVAESVQQPFNLGQGPLIHCRLLRLNAQEHVLSLTLHHIISDGWSTGVLVRELAALYSAHLAGTPSSLPKLSIQYADYAVWQRKRLQGEALEQQLNYWAQQLADLPMLNLPLDWPRPAIQNFRGGYATLTLGPALTTALKELSQREGATLFMTLLAAFQLLLGRYSHQDDIAVGSPIAGRTTPESAGLIGFFVNTLVLRTDLSGDPKFHELLQRVRKTCLQAYAHQDLPFDKIVEELRPERDLSHNPFFDVLFNFMDTSQLELEMPGLQLRSIETAIDSKFAITLYINDQDETISLRLVYQRALFSAERIDQILDQFGFLLEQIAAAPQQPIQSYSLVPPTTQLLLPDPTVEMDEPQYEPVTAMFRSWAERLPEQPALSQDQRSLGYRELAQRVDTLARVLLLHGLERGDVVAVSGPRSFGLITSMLAAFTSGGVMLTIDRNYPSNRQRIMVQEAQATYVLYVGQWRPEDQWMREIDSLTIIAVDTEGSASTSAPHADLESLPLPAVRPDDAAYIFFTSGTTTVPKGVLGWHNGLSHFLTWQRTTFEIGPHDRAAQLTGLAFNVLLRDVFTPLTSGATLCLPPTDEHVGSDQILHWMEREQITVVHTVPSLAQSWLINPPRDVTLRTLRWIFSAGEPLTDTLVRQWRASFPESSGRIILVYGQTETTLAKFCYPVPQEVLPGVQPVGRPLPHTQALVLAPNGRRCGIGEPGEVVIRTPFRTLGYINAPEEQRRRFVQNPFRDDPQDIVYYTGDRGRYRLDGMLELLGRADDQVKIRGIRVEPAEVQACLGRHPGVRATVVIVREQPSGTKHLIAYIVASQESPLTTQELRTFLKEHVPAYMIPQAFVVLDRLPLTPNGKVDWRALPLPDETQTQRERAFVAPRTLIEETVAGICATILNLEQVGVDDNFFELGGHSLLATLLVSRIRETFGIELPLRALFQDGTIAALAQQIERTRLALPESLQLPLEPITRDGQLPLSFAQQRLWFLDQLEPASRAYLLPSVLHLRGSLSQEALEQSFSAIIERHEILRTTFPLVDDQPVQMIHPAEPVVLPIAAIDGLPDAERAAEVQRLIQDHVQHGFDLQHGPLLRATLIRLQADEHLLLINMHHIISDGWSTGVFIQDMIALYRAFTQNIPAQLPNLPIQYADYAHWQRRQLQGTVLQAQLNYWQRQLGAVSPLQLPTDRPRPPMQTYVGATRRELFSLTLTQALLTLSRQEDATLFMTLVAAFQVLLARYSGQHDIAVGTPIANRTRRETEGLIGCFINTLVLRTDLSGDPSFRELLHRVREVSLDAYAHQDLPFEHIVEAVQPERDVSRSPLFQVMFILQNMPLPVAKLGDLTLEPVPIERNMAQFDLTFDMQETANGLALTVEYNTDLYDAVTIDRMIQHFRLLLEAIATDADRRFSTLPLLSEQERQYLIVEWNDTARAYPGDMSFAQIFAAQVRHRPHAVALADPEGSLTYQELAQHALDLAAVLHAEGVGPESLVGLLLPRNRDLLIAILAVFHLGAAYLPLDLAYPPARLHHLLAQSNCQLLLTGPEGCRRLEEQPLPAILTVLNLSMLNRAHRPAPPAAPSAPDHLAYVIYTSGSTGQPKGAMVTQRGMINHLFAKQQDLALTDADAVAQTASQCFDISVWQFLVPLLNGGRVVLVPDEIAHDPLALLPHLQAQQVTVWEAVPAVLRAVLQAHPQPLALPALRWLLLTGEALPPELARAWFAQYPAIPLLNAYGPTECADDVTHYVLDEPPTTDVWQVPIGTPLANTQIYVVDGAAQLVPLGVLGELYVGGDGVGRGYLYDPVRTALQFVPDPWSGRPGARMYRTGDRARLRPDGQVEYFGRLDTQIKLRGQRIELGEIEAVLEQQPTIAAAVVVVHGSGDLAQLVAYVVRQPVTAATDESALRTALASQLPPPLVPEVFVELESLPLNANGKVDRAALPAPTITGRSAEPLRTPLEALIAKIWSEVLGRDVTDRNTSFFALGGHSLLATQVVTRLRQALQVEVPLRTLFEAPTVALLAETTQRVQQSQIGGNNPPILPLKHRDSVALSFAQQRLWFLDQLEPNSAVYNLPTAVLLRGTIHLDALQHAVSEIVRRHAATRTTFPTVNDQPVQVIMPAELVPFRLTDLQSLPAEERQVQAQRLMLEIAQRPFDLQHGPLLRIDVLRLCEIEHIVMVVMHHIVSDGWSMGVLVREMVALYKAFVHEAPSPLPELPIQYVDFAVWQRNWLQGSVLEQQLAYWKDQLSDVPELLDLPTDHTRPSTQTYRGARYPLIISKALTEQLNTLSQREGVTLFMTLLAAFNTLLYRYSGQQDIVVGTPIANRTHDKTEELIGFFVNTLVLRTILEDELSFRMLLSRVRNVALQAYAHQDVPFELLVETIQPERSLTHNPIFQVMFAFQNAPMPATELPGVTLSPLPIERETTMFDLTLNLTETVEDVRGTIEYATDLFEIDTIASMAVHFEMLLEQILINPDQPLKHLRLLTPEEQMRLVTTWNNTATAYPATCSLAHLVEAQAQRTPDALAVVGDSESLSYLELDQRANQLAHYLRSLGVGPEMRVGVYLDRTPDMVVGLLGILKAGGAYVPIDSAYPADRIQFMLTDARLAVVLTHGYLQQRLPPTSALVVMLDVDWPIIASQAGSAPSNLIDPDNAAYIIYTSGSTGTPKGVVVPHRTIINHMHWMHSDLPLQSSDRVLQKTPISFDASVWEFYAPLMSGAELVLAEPGGHQDPAYLIEAIQRHQITILQVVPTLLGMLLATPGFADCSSLRRIFCGGEAFSSQLAAQCRALLPEATIYNLYGPSETTVEITFSTWSADDGRASVPIGRPIANAHVYLLDTQGQLVPRGVPGELFIGGVCVARGYFDRPGLTAERFVPDHLSGRAGARLYRTGDLARYRPDGQLEFIGRHDNQIKLRGYRVELGEIEAQLRQHSALRDVAVLVRRDQQQEQQLVAYVVPHQSTSVSLTSLRQFLQPHLPAYMIPTQLVVLETFPRTATGKLNHQALPAPEGTRTTSLPLVAPRNGTEAILAELWSQILGLPAVSVHDNFFDLGGHSLLATQVIARIRTIFNLNLPLRTLFESPTIASFATILADAQRTSTLQAAPPLLAQSHARPLPLSFAQQRLWFLDQWHPQSTTYNIAAAVALHGSLNLEALNHSLQAVVQRHATLRTTFVVEDGQPVQHIAPTLALSVQHLNLQALPIEEHDATIQQAVTAEASRPFDLQQGPVLRVTLLALSPNKHVVLFTMHHIVTDGWSMEILIREIIAFYSAAVQQQPASLRDLPLQYADFALWQHDWLRDTVIERLLDYWRVQLADAEPLTLPTDRPRPAELTFQGAGHTFKLDRSLHELLLTLSQQAGVTLFMTVLAAFQVLLARYSRQNDIVVGTPVANRTQTEIEHLIGCFVNTLVLRTRLDGNPAFSTVLEQVRETCLQAYAHQDVPFEKIVEVLQPMRDLSHHPLFQVMLVLQNTPQPLLEVPDLVLEPIAIPTTTAKFDLTLTLTATDDGLQGQWEYNTDLFEATTIERMTVHFQTLLEAIVADPQQPINYLPLLTEAERQATLIDWNLSAADYPRDAAVHQLIEAQAARTPNTAAIVFDGASLSYAELNARSNQLAHYLRVQGVGPDTLVALMVERSLEMIVGMLAILKAGGAYVPLDPNYPADRVQYMLSHSQTPVILTQAALVNRLPEHTARVFRLDADWDRLAEYPATNPARTALPDHLAYIIYTSGSTGRPKGVMVKQQGLINLVYGLRQYFEDCAVRNVSLISSIGFDASVNQIFPTLIFGRTLHIISDSVKFNSRALLRYLDEYQIHLLDAVPSYLQAVLNEVAPEQPANALHYLLIGGEKLEQRLLRSVFSQLGSAVEIVNIYGLTEISDINILSSIRVDDLDKPITVGKPLQNNRIYILDAFDQPQPVGIAGEVCVSGESVSRGYVFRPELTADRFVACPFERGQIMVRTGDLGRWRSDGTVEILGRIDHQVKIRGFRIETGEIEAVLAAHSGINECIVVVHEDASGDKRLVAYIEPVKNQNAELQDQTMAPETQNQAEADSGVGQETSVLSASELRAFLFEQLPDYMVPNLFVELATLPKTPSGKIDRRALPAPTADRPELDSVFVAPRTPLEATLSRIWMELLGLERIGVHDNFFALGGHSLLAVQLIARIQEQLSMEIPLRTLFEAPTVAGLADHIAAVQDDGANGSLPLTASDLNAGPAPTSLTAHIEAMRWNAFVEEPTENLDDDLYEGGEL